MGQGWVRQAVVEWVRPAYSASAPTHAHLRAACAHRPQDASPDKVNLGVGAYRDNDGKVRRVRRSGGRVGGCGDGHRHVGPSVCTRHVRTSRRSRTTPCPPSTQPYVLPCVREAERRIFEAKLDHEYATIAGVYLPCAVCAPERARGPLRRTSSP